MDELFDSLCFTVVLIAFIASLTYKKYAIGRKDAMFLRIGMAFTLLADFSMLIIHKNEIGLVFFCCVQCIYCWRYTGAVRARILGFIIIVMSVVLFTNASAVVENLPAYMKLSAIYAVCLLFSVSGAVSAFFARTYTRPNNCLVLAGMLLFLLCDISVMVYNLNVPRNVEKAFQLMIWVFYLPSQFLLAGSAKQWPYGNSKRE